MPRPKTRSAAEARQQLKSARAAYAARQEAAGRRQRNIRLTELEYARVLAFVIEMRSESHK